MSDLLPASGHALEPRRTGEPSSMLLQAKQFAAQPAIRRTLPFAGVAAVLGGAAIVWSVLSAPAQKVLYSDLADSEKASVAEALDKAAIAYNMDPSTGAITVGESDIYRARMIVASDGAVAAPATGTELIDSMPMGASRLVEAERVRAARERELELTIKEIDGVDSVRVHLAEPEKSVFVRESSPPRASVMLKLRGGRRLGEGQINAIVNLLAGSVPGLSPDDVKVVDQHGALLSDEKNAGADSSDRLELQTRMEAKLRSQVTQLLTPIYGPGNFSTEVQIDLDMNAVTSARESWNKDGVVRSETTQSSTPGTNSASTLGGGVPGTLSNTPPPETEVVSAEQKAPAPAAGGQGAAPTPAPSPTDQNVSRTYELGREVAVSNGAPGSIKRLSVAVVVSKAEKTPKPAELAQLNKLVSAAVGANPQRGDQVEIIVQQFKEEAPVEQPFYEQPWFETVLRNAVALVAVLLVIFFGMKPAMAAIRRKQQLPAATPGTNPDTGSKAGGAAAAGVADRLAQMPLAEQLGLAQQYMTQRPDSAAAAIRQMLVEDESGSRTSAA